MIAADEVVLVSVDDAEVGTMDKLAAHQGGGRLHRAVSVSVTDRNGHVLLQKRSADKALFAGLWSNACCTHPKPGESVAATAARRCTEELGIAVVSLQFCGRFTYRARDAKSGLVEWEVDHVFTALAEGTPTPDPTEVTDVRWVTWDDAVVTAGRAISTPWMEPVLMYAQRNGRQTRQQR